MGQSLCLQTGVDIDDVHARVSILRSLLEVLLISRAFGSLGQGATNVLRSHPVDLQLSKGVSHHGARSAAYKS